jgi:vancomycin resistance protein YoaR
MSLVDNARPATRPRLNPWLVRVPLLLIMAGTLTVIALATLLSGYQIAVAGSIVPGVSANGVALGGQTPAQAAAALETAFTYDDDMVFTFRHEDRFWQFTAAELGVRMDAEATAQAAFEAGHGGVPGANLLGQVEIWTQGLSVAPIITYDESAARAALTTIAAELERPLQNAALVMDGTTVTTTPAQPGRTLDVTAALDTLRTRITALEPGGEMDLIVTETQPKLADAAPTAAYIRAAVGAPLTLTAQDTDGERLGPWTVTPGQIASALTVNLVANADGSAEYTVDVDLSALAPTLDALAPGLVTPARNGRFTYDEANKQLVTLEPAIDGRQIDIPATIAALEAAVFQVDNRTVPVQFRYERPTYHNDVTAAELGVTELVSSSRTFYTGSTAARRANIELAASFYNGLIIGPGETFSFNEHVGDITAEQGFLESAIIFGGRTVNGIGGGVCQVSTTVFRAAFEGGFPIVERYSHGYRVGYYELGGVGPGLDAAIFTPTADFKFTNDTDHHLLIETEFMGEIDAVEFRFYSTNPGRTVEISQPVLRNITPPTPTVYEENNNLQPGQQLQVDWSQEGGDVIITRIIRDLDGNILQRRDFGTFYQPWSAVIQVPPGDPRVSS